jgi:two-component sensor histidine kinase
MKDDNARDAVGLADHRSTRLEMAALVADVPWGETALGPAAHWPQSLKTIVDVILHSPLAMVVLWGPDLIQIYNAGYAEICAAKHPKALGQPTRDCWPEVWDFNAPIYDAVRRGEVRSFDRQLLTIARSGQMEDAWFDLTYSPVREEGGAVGGVLVTVVESTDHVLLHRVMEAAVADGVRLKSLFERAPGFVAVLEGPSHTFNFANHAYRRLIGDRDLIGRTVRAVLPELEGQGFFELLDRVYATGLAHVGRGTPIMFSRSAEREPEQSYLDFLYEPMRGPDNQIIGIFVQGSDVTARVLADENQALLMGEMTHRVKNALATVLGLARLLSMSAASVEQFMEALSARVLAMAKIQDLLTAGRSEPVSVCEVIKVELAPYIGERVALNCEDLVIEAAAGVNLSLIVHELLTNALKYGALSVLGGHLEVSCRDAEGGAALVWTETTMAPLHDIGAPGFGAQLINRLVRALRGVMTADWRSTGLRVVVTFKATPGLPETGERQARPTADD